METNKIIKSSCLLKNIQKYDKKQVIFSRKSERCMRKRSYLGVSCKTSFFRKFTGFTSKLMISNFGFFL